MGGTGSIVVSEVGGTIVTSVDGGRVIVIEELFSGSLCGSGSPPEPGPSIGGAVTGGGTSGRGPVVVVVGASVVEVVDVEEVVVVGAVVEVVLVEVVLVVDVLLDVVVG